MTASVSWFLSAAAVLTWVQAALPTCPLQSCSKAFRPGHFTCTSCDAVSCEKCGIVCDLSKCIGQFYDQECWCHDKGAPDTRAEWQLGPDYTWVTPGIQRHMCSRSCTGGGCDDANIQCRKKEDVCEPWWFCGSEPPKERNKQVSLEQIGAELRSHLEKPATRLRLNFQERRIRRRFGASEKAHVREASSQALGSLSFIPSMLICQNAALLQTDAVAEGNLVVLDPKSCSGSQFSSECFCWDNFKLLRGEDPMTSELMCDSKCGSGPCLGRSCMPKKGGSAPPKAG
mmetsp:Transcript_46239/g.100517  ORF Transcript_46239/g.100517 Transcript_46239/m.100517 type:complete len:286 (-) Transcript_46239:150-1007(-)